MLYEELHHYKNDTIRVLNNRTCLDRQVLFGKNYNELIILDDDIPNVKHIFKYLRPSYILEKNFEQFGKKTNKSKFVWSFFQLWISHRCVATPSNFWLQRTLENFLRESQTFPRYVTSSPNWELSNGTKIITCGLLEKNRHAYFKKRHPHWPFVSYFSISVFKFNYQLQSSNSIFDFNFQILSSTSIFALLSPYCHFKFMKLVEKVQN